MGLGCRVIGIAPVGMQFLHQTLVIGKDLRFAGTRFLAALLSGHRAARGRPYRSFGAVVSSGITLAPIQVALQQERQTSGDRSGTGPAG